MACTLRAQLRWIAAFAVIFISWFGGTGRVEAGCGDHGYLVQRSGGEVMVVTPSQPGCPCNGPTCHQREDRGFPISPVWVPAPALDAWVGSEGFGLAAPQRVHLSDCFLCLSFCRYSHEILQPPRV